MRRVARSPVTPIPVLAVPRSRIVACVLGPVLAGLLGGAVADPGVDPGARADEIVTDTPVEANARGAGADRTVVEPIAAAARSAPRAEITVLGARALFASNTDALSADGVMALERLAAELLSRHVDADAIVAIRVVGHTDGIGAADYNLQLSEHRAAAVGRILARRHPGVPLVIEGKGESAPVASDADAAGRARNRRVEIHVVAIDGQR